MKKDHIGPEDIKQLNCFQHWLLISVGSRDNEDWSNDAENSALLHRNKLHFIIE